MALADTMRDYQRPELHAIDGSGNRIAYAVTFDDKGKLTLPDPPAHSDHAALCAWLTAVLGLDPRHPVIRGLRHGVDGPEGHVELQRAEAASIRFEPASKLNAPNKLIESLTWYALPTDGMAPAFKGEHCRQIVFVVRMLCGIGARVTAVDEAAGIVSAYLNGSQPVEGFTTVGTSPQRYEAATALQRDVDDMSGRPIGPPRYLIDAETGATIIRISDLQETARRYIGGSVPRGFLDARMDALGWERITLDGHQSEGRSGRTGPHARCRAYRGSLSTEGVTT